MKKNYLIISCLLISFLGFSQSNTIFGSWILVTLKSDNNVYNISRPEENKTDDNGEKIILNLNESPNTTFDTYICNSMEGQISLNETNRTLTIISKNTALDSCSNLVDSDFENLYFAFFQASSTYNYEIGCLLSGDSCYLYLHSPNGDEATFWNGKLSTNKNEKLDLFVYLNTVKDRLNIISSKNNIKTKIFDINGKLIQENVIQNTKSINVENLKNGFYFIVIEDEFGNIGTKKFVK